MPILSKLPAAPNYITTLEFPYLLLLLLLLFPPKLINKDIQKREICIYDFFRDLFYLFTHTMYIEFLIEYSFWLVLVQDPPSSSSSSNSSSSNSTMCKVYLQIVVIIVIIIWLISHRRHMYFIQQSGLSFF